MSRAQIYPRLYTAIEVGCACRSLSRRACWSDNIHCQRMQQPNPPDTIHGGSLSHYLQISPDNISIHTGGLERRLLFGGRRRTFKIPPGPKHALVDSRTEHRQCRALRAL